MSLLRPASLLFALFTATLGLQADETEPQQGPTFEIKAGPALPTARQAHVIGLSNGALIVAGGRDLAGNADTAILVSPSGSEEWIVGGELPQVMVGSASARSGEGVILLGGEGAAAKKIYQLTWNGSSVDVIPLPDLPVALNNPSATVGDGKLYVAGQANDAAGESRPVFLQLAVAPSLSFLQRLLEGVGFDFTPEETDWAVAEPWPGPVLDEASLTFSFESAHLFGRNAREEIIGFGYHPSHGWRTLNPPTTALGDATAVGESHIFFTAPSTAPGVESRLVAYHTLTDRWIDALGLPAAVEGNAHLTTNGDQIVAVSSQAVTRMTVQPPPNNYGWVDHTVVAMYLVGMVAMGAWFVRRERDTNDYFRASNKVPWWAIGMSLFATGASAISLMTMPGKSYSTNWTFFAISLYSVICLPLSLFLLAPLVRKLDIATANEYLELRFGLTARMLGSIIFMVNQVLGRMAPIIFLPSIAMSAITGIDIWIWILVIGSVTTLYTFLGGLSAVIWTDTVQGLIMLGTVAGCLILILFKVDMPLGEMWTTLQSQEKLHMFDWGSDITEPTVIMVFVGTMFITLLGIGDQNYVQRVQAAPSLRDAKKAVATQMGVAIPINILLFGLGTALYLYYRSHPIELNPVMKTDGVYPLFAAQHLPVGVSGLVIAALLAASMSTISSAICSVANLGVDDFYRRFKSQVSEREALILARVFSITVGICGIVGAIFLSLSDSKSVWDAALIITGLITNGTVGLFGLGLLTRKAHELGAILGLVAGMIVTIYLQAFTPVTFWLYMAFGSAVTFGVGYLISLVVPFARKPIAGLTVYTLDQPRRRL